MRHPERSNGSDMLGAMLCLGFYCCLAQCLLFVLLHRIEKDCRKDVSGKKSLHFECGDDDGRLAKCGRSPNLIGGDVDIEQTLVTNHTTMLRWTLARIGNACDVLLMSFDEKELK